MSRKGSGFLSVFSVVALLLLLMSTAALACTVIAVGKDATVDGSAMITHNDDSRTANSRLFIIPEADWPEGSMRDIVKDAHGYEGDAQKIDETRYSAIIEI